MNRRFYTPQIPPVGDDVELSSDESHHLRSVLRARAGEDIELLDGGGVQAQAQITRLPAGKGGTVCCTIQSRRRLPRPTPRVTLCIAPPRGKLMRQIVRQATELGVYAVQPVLCERSESRPRANACRQWQASAVEACKQSGNAFLPICHPPADLAELLAAGVGPGYVGCVPDAGADAGGAPTAAVEGEDVTLWIGPEGGFHPDELQLLLRAGLTPVIFGPWTLRTVTAAVAGLAWLQQRYCT
jgi:16S rRNA (uracil1498-N3)-methyltransferase